LFNVSGGCFRRVEGYGCVITGDVPQCFRHPFYFGGFLDTLFTESAIAGYFKGYAAIALRERKDGDMEKK